MTRFLRNLLIVGAVLTVLWSKEIKADTVSTSNTPSTSSLSSASATSFNNTASAATSNKSTTTKQSVTTSSPKNAASPADTTTPTSLISTGVSNNVQSASVQVEPSVGSAGLSIPISVPAGRAGIQPHLAVTYNSSLRQLGNAGVGWTLDVGSIQISTKKGVPKYDGTDIFMMEQDGATQDLVADPNTPGLYHMEVEGAFANIQFYTTYWVITDKKGIKYYYGNTSDSIQSDPANPTHIFRWALNRVEDLNGNYMTISYLNDNGQIYPQTISYTGNDTSSLILSTYAQVSISYVAASSPSISYISKFLVKTAQRIDHINVCVGTNSTICDGTDAQSTYTFTYHQSANTQRDLLQSVQQTGADGTTQLPAVTFTYNEALPQWQLASGWTIPSDFTLNMNSLDAGIKILDLNGDGYSDFLRIAYSGGFISYSYSNNGLNNNKGWTLNNNWVLSSTTEIKTSGFDWGIRLADFNGDGLMDIAQEIGPLNNTPVLNPQQFYLNNSNGWDTAQNFTMPSGVYFALDPNIVFEFNQHIAPPTPQGVEIGDVNGDGFPDLVQSIQPDYGGTFTAHGVYVNQYPQGSNSFSVNSSFTLPASTYTDFTQGAMLVDLTGDGLSDIIYRSGGVSHVFMNTGTGFVEDTSSGWNAYPQYGDFMTQTTQMVDVNGDGLPDMVITTNGDRADATILLNTGSGWSLYQGKIGDFNFYDFGTQFLDANADGMMGYLTYESGGSPELYLNANKPVDLLIGVNNGIGASTSIQYDSDFHYQNTYMPYFLPVVKSTTTTVGSQSYTTSYNYAGGLWDKNYHEFDGFKTVTVTDPEGNYAMMTYLQDHWLKGNLSEQDTYDSSGNPYSKTVNQWQTQTIVTNTTSNQISKFLYISRIDNYLYDGSATATPKRTAQEFTYGENPQYGDATQTINDGQVDPTAGTSIDANKTTTNVSYVYNTTSWLLGLPVQTTTLDTNGNKISQTSFYYDGDTTGSAAPTFGHLTTKVNWLDSLTQADPKTTYTYDAYGNLQTTTDPTTDPTTYPNGNTTTITYDNTVHMFPEKTTNALNQTDTMTYYGIDGASLNNGQGLQGLWGQSRSKTDANNQTAYTTYDVLGRPLTSISPLDTVALPTDQKTYNIQSSYIAVTDTARVNNGSTATISTVSYYDGLGRLIETKSLGPTSGQYIASGQTVYDDRGLPIAKYLPYFTTNDLNTPDTIADAANAKDPYSQAAYDSMGRVKTKTNPDGTYSSIAYNQWAATITDENGHQQISYVDAFGHLIKKEEYTGADGRSANYPATSYNLYATTTYGYDPKGNLTSVIDAKNNVTTISYDNLNRKIAMSDPDMGKWQYGYDGNGNLIWQEDAKDQVISFQYDALNRLINKTDAISGPIVNLPNLTPQPATFNVKYNFDDTTQNYGIGRLGSVNYDMGSAAFVYDQLGHEVSSNKTIDGTTYNVTRQYDALNRLQQLQYPDGAQVVYVYNQAGQVAGVADAGAVVNGVITSAALETNTSNDRLAWFDKALGVGNAYAATTTPVAATMTSPIPGSTLSKGAVKFTWAKGSKVSDYALYVGTTGVGSSDIYSDSKTTATTISVSTISLNGNLLYVRLGSLVSGSWQYQDYTYQTRAFVLPTVSITLPADGSSFSAASNIKISTGAASSQGKITKVEFYNGPTLLGKSTASPYAFTWDKVSEGNYSISAKVYDSNNNTGTSAPINIIVSGLPTVGLTAVTEMNSGSSTANINLTAAASEINGTITGVAFYKGSTLLGIAISSPYTFIWTNVAQGSYSFTAQAYDANNKTAISKALAITVNPLVAPTVSLTSPGNNSSLTAPTKVTLTASASAPNATISKVDFYEGTTLLGTVTSSPYTYTWNNPVPGIYSLTAVATDSKGFASTSSAINLTISQPMPTVSLTSPSNNASYTTSSNITLTVNATTSYGNISKVEFLNGTTLLGTATSSPYTYTWTNVAAGTYSLTAKVFNDGVVATSTAVNVTVNAPAVVGITSPSNNATYSSPVNIVIDANASASSGTISKVAFYNGAILLGIVTSAPYTYSWNNVGTGSYALTAVATQSNGMTASSSTVSVIVDPHIAPTVNLISPSSNASYTLPANITLTANATATNATISQIAFYNSTTLLGIVTGNPYTYTWNNMAAGTYNLTAVATDRTGATATSSTVSVTVSPHIAPTVSLTSPSNNASLTAPTNITLSATAGATDATISQVSFYNGTTLLGTATSSPYTYTWNNAAPGNYNLTAVATDSSGATAVSSIVRIAVIQPAPTVSLAANSSTYAAPGVVALTATASEAGGTISRVDFYNGATLLGSSNSSPYVYTWDNVAVGNYSLTAEAYDNNGVESISNTVSINVVAPNVYISSINYNANGQITQIQYGNGVVTAYTYDPSIFRLTRIYTSTKQNDIVQDLNYTYDSIGQVLTIIDNANTNVNTSMSQTFVYDALNRLVSATGSYGTKTYAYDTIGNITQKDGLTYTYTGTGPHAVNSLSDGSVFQYDANGNMISLQKGSNLTQYVYDSQNRLQTVKVGGLIIAAYTYDGDGGRIKKTVYRRDLALYNDNTIATLFGNLNGTPLPATAQNPSVDTTRYVGNLYETETPSSDNANQNRLTKFIYLGSTRVAAVGNDGNVLYYHTDHLGGTNVLTDQTGSMRELTEYDPFGQVIVHDKYGNDFSTIWYYFTGKPLDDETGLIFLGARYYNPVLGRFITPDTEVQAPSNPQTLNRYTYCNNNPVNLTDPTGHSWWKKFWKGVEKVFSYILGGVFFQSQVYQAFQGNWMPLVSAGIGLAASLLLPGIGEFASNIFLNIAVDTLVGAAEGAIVGGITSEVLGGTFAQGAEAGAIGGGIGGAINGFTSSQQFQNWQKSGFASGGFQSNAELEQQREDAVNFANQARLSWNNDLAQYESTESRDVDEELGVTSTSAPYSGLSQPVYQNTQFASAVGHSVETVNNLCEDISAVTSLPANQLQVASTGVFTGNYTELYSTAPSNANFSNLVRYGENGTYSAGTNYGNGEIRQSRWPN